MRRAALWLCALCCARSASALVPCDDHAKCVFGNCEFKRSAVAFVNAHNGVAAQCLTPEFEVLASHEFGETADTETRSAIAAARASCPFIRPRTAHCSRAVTTTVLDSCLIALGSVCAVIQYHHLITT